MTRVRHAIAAILVLVLMAGCEDGGVGVDPKDSVKISGAELDSTRAEMLDLINTAVTSASRAAGGQELRSGDEIKSTVCDSIYPRRFRIVEVSGGFVVPGADRATVVGKIRDAWLAEGWKPEVGSKEVAGEDDEVTATKKTSSGARLGIRALVGATPDKGVANINIRTSCLELSKGALDSLDSRLTEDS